jgi:hypothetical protein
MFETSLKITKPPLGLKNMVPINMVCVIATHTPLQGYSDRKP